MGMDDSGGDQMTGKDRSQKRYKSPKKKEEGGVVTDGEWGRVS